MSSKKRTPKTLTKRERKALFGRGPSGAPKAASKNQHIHCIACGAHLDPAEFDGSPATARWIRCEHGSSFPCCLSCEPEATRRLAEHDRTGRPVQVAQAWH